ncbi:allophanate hydrolase subunit 1 [Kribbella sp. NBC_01245]|uniref:5-oxoprolinase subunit B family protein n=1 Tax=Kribbella sp. NBC_01245 TaxID=2903578 RepID=UPI002E2E7042|nr:allophanate hydrolase subunit 1 [Kribbella sp. NBC_01245]
MRVLPCGESALLVELDSLDEVLGYYATLAADPPAGVVDLVPAARTVMVSIDLAASSLASLEKVLKATTVRADRRATGELVEIPVVYDGADLGDVAELLGCSEREVVERHTGEEWTVAFCGFAPGFGYLTSGGDWDIPRRSSPRTKVPPGSIALAAEFSGVYPRESPGGWQLIGRTSIAVFDLKREPAALLRPGVRVRFAEVSE